MQKAADVLPASMGPRLGSRGKLAGFVQHRPGADVLQWGRDLEVAERATSSTRTQPSKVLQWGRDLEVAERNLARLKIATAAELQWGRDLEVAERSPSQLLF